MERQREDRQCIKGEAPKDLGPAQSAGEKESRDRSQSFSKGCLETLSVICSRRLSDPSPHEASYLCCKPRFSNSGRPNLAPCSPRPQYLSLKPSVASLPTVNRGQAEIVMAKVPEKIPVILEGTCRAVGSCPSSHLM